MSLLNLGFGVTQQGFNCPQLTDIQADINATLLSTFGAGANLSAGSVLGQISGIFAEREAIMWQAIQAAYNSQYPDTAFGASLDNVGALNAIRRFGALPSTILGVSLFGTAGTLIPATTTQFSIANQPTQIFSTNFAVTLGAGQNCIQTLSFSQVPDLGTFTLTINGQSTTQIPFSCMAGDIQAAIILLPFCSGCTVTGNFTTGFTVWFQGAGTGGLMSQPLIIATSFLTKLGSPVVITPLITQPGLNQATVDCTAINTGPTIANINSLTTIVTPISGLSQVFNTTPSIPGRSVETDNAYRLRRTQELQITGGGTFNALYSQLMGTAGVTAVVLQENWTNVTDSFGNPPKSFQAFVQGGTAAEIGATIAGTKPLGIEPYGTNLIQVTDSQGTLQNIYYSVPTEVPVYIIAELGVTAAYPTNGDSLVLSALIAYGETMTIGQTLVVSPILISQLAGIPGINTATLLVGTSPSPTLSNNITLLANQVASFDPSYISVVHV